MWSEYAAHVLACQKHGGLEFLNSHLLGVPDPRPPVHPERS